MKRIPVNSGNIVSIGYMKKNKILEIEFKTGSIYHYENMEEILYLDLINAPSIGRFFNLEIRNVFPFKKGEWKEKTQMPNIYICGKAGAGKTASAQYLIEKLGYIQAKFAYPVYGLAYDYFKMDKKDRLLLQTIGTNCAREVVSEDIWVKRFAEDTKIVQLTRKAMGLPEVGLVCDDCRFPNENKILKENDWIGVFLNVSDEDRIKRLRVRDGDAQVASLGHSSELGVDEFKMELIQIDSSGTLEEVYAQLDSLIETLKPKA